MALRRAWRAVGLVLAERRQRRDERRAARALETLDAGTLSDIGAPDWLVNQARRRAELARAWRDLDGGRLGMR